MLADELIQMPKSSFKIQYITWYGRVSNIKALWVIGDFFGTDRLNSYLFSAN
jgi:hypothetical protein